MDLKINFSTQRWFGLCSVCIGWYALILLTNPEEPPVYAPNSKQMLGLAVALIMGVLAWVKKCLIINPEK